MSALAAVAPGTTGSLSVATVVADAQEKTKGYLARIEAAVEDPGQCIEESHLDKGVVDYRTRTVGKVWMGFVVWLLFVQRPLLFQHVSVLPHVRCLTSDIVACSCCCRVAVFLCSCSSCCCCCDYGG